MFFLKIYIYIYIYILYIYSEIDFEYRPFVDVWRNVVQNE